MAVQFSFHTIVSKSFETFVYYFAQTLGRYSASLFYWKFRFIILRRVAFPYRKNVALHKQAIVRSHGNILNLFTYRYRHCFGTFSHKIGTYVYTIIFFWCKIQNMVYFIFQLNILFLFYDDMYVLGDDCAMSQRWLLIQLWCIAMSKKWQWAMPIYARARNTKSNPKFT